MKTLTISPIQNGDDYEAVADLLNRAGYSAQAELLQTERISVPYDGLELAFNNVLFYAYGQINYSISI
jgi:hypothetical protein